MLSAEERRTDEKDIFGGQPGDESKDIFGGQPAGVLAKEIGHLISPTSLKEKSVVDEVTAENINISRHEVRRIIHGEDDRLLCVVGPCSIHDPKAALDYAKRLMILREKYKRELLVIMRVYFEKPRTTVGWKGLINDPELSGTFKVNQGLEMGRKVLLDINKLGMPCGCEFLDVISPRWLADLVSWGAIGARTTESQVHREMASGLACPIGFKNSTTGDVKIASNAILSARSGHTFLSITEEGRVAVVQTNGNKNTHVVLRGGSNGPNYDHVNVMRATTMLRKNMVNPRLVIDCSHGNSQKLHTNQLPVADDIAKQVARGNGDIVGIMCESFLFGGKQKFTPGKDDKSKLKYGQSITDACVDVPTTDHILSLLAKAVQDKRTLLRHISPTASQTRELILSLEATRDIDHENGIFNFDE